MPILTSKNQAQNSIVRLWHIACNTFGRERNEATHENKEEYEN